MNKKKLLKNIFKKETFINNIKASYQDLIWLLTNIILGKDFFTDIISKRTKLYIYTI